MQWHPEAGLVPGQGAHWTYSPALPPGSEPPRNAPPEAACRGLWRRAIAGHQSHRSRSLRQGAPQRRAPGRPPSSLPASRPPTYRLQHAGVGGAPSAGEGAGRRAEAAAAARPRGASAPGAPRPERARLAEARAAGGAAGGAGGGVAGPAGGASGGRSEEEWEGAREPAGEQLPHQHLRRLRSPDARRQLSGRIAWCRLSFGEAPGSERAASLLTRCLPRSGGLGVPGAGGAGAALAGRSPARISSGRRAAASSGGPEPHSPPAAPSTRAPGLQTRAAGQVSS